MKYRIKYSYRTGNSFGSSDEEAYLDLGWNNLKIAKKNLQAIREHYKLYEKFESHYPRLTEEQRKEEVDKVKHNDWYAGKQNFNPKSWDDCFYATHCIKLQADNGGFMQISCPWCGYFETLHGAEIVEEESDMKFSLR